MGTFGKKQRPDNKARVDKAVSMLMGLYGQPPMTPSAIIKYFLEVEKVKSKDTRYSIVNRAIEIVSEEIKDRVILKADAFLLFHYDLLEQIRKDPALKPFFKYTLIQKELDLISKLSGHYNTTNLIIDDGEFTVTFGDRKNNDQKDE